MTPNAKYSRRGAALDVLHAEVTQKSLVLFYIIVIDSKGLRDGYHRIFTMLNALLTRVAIINGFKNLKFK